MTPALLALEDGTIFRGKAIGADGMTVGEVVFNTAMTGYQEILTDPSYARQLVTLTYPHIGNTGCNEVDMEAAQPMAGGLIIRDLPSLASNWRKEETLGEFLSRNGIVGIADIDTRKLTRILREKGAQNGAIVAGEELDVDAAIEAARGFPGLKGMDLAREVSTAERYEWNDGGTYDLDGQRFHPGKADLQVVAYDYGCKRNILRLLSERGCRVTVVPATTPVEEVLKLDPDGVFHSNGPGDPEPCDYAIANIRQLLERKVPQFGICLGHQLLGLAAGARSIKMKFGHHGANHPVVELETGRVLITSQNHGFAVDEESLPKSVEATHRSLFDGSLQGIRFSDAPAFGFQGHPEASPGPHDVRGLFDRFVELMNRGESQAA
ncbi:MAG: glutamine-hydrolyzing carbamoyl-phosphate synthase small subunit [Xanthomonadales bacterium]|nr:glutamine-hydrolyzing carbamoyl-phosphate synthase small subunit [Xanthomonadales bacterium]